MSLSNYDYTKLLDGLKLIARSIHVVANEINDLNRHEAELLATDIVDRVFRDIKEMAEDFIPVEHDGSIEQIIRKDS